MIRGLYTSATGMLAQQKKMDTITNNIANVDTAGFKKDGVVTRAFDEELTRRLNDKTLAENVTIVKKIGDMSLGAFVQEVYTDFTQANLEQTNNSLDVALDSEGFIAINHTNTAGEVSEKYTRDGIFTRNAGGILMTTDGYSVAGVENETIELRDGEVYIDESGAVYVDDEYIDTIKIVNFENMGTLRKYGENLWDITEETNFTEYTGNVLQGFREGSNVNTVSEMVSMITAMRAYEVNQKMIQTHDQTLSKAVNDIK